MYFTRQSVYFPGTAWWFRNCAPGVECPCCTPCSLKHGKGVLMPVWPNRSCNNMWWNSLCSTGVSEMAAVDGWSTTQAEKLQNVLCAEGPVLSFNS